MSLQEKNQNSKYWSQCLDYVVLVIIISFAFILGDFSHYLSRENSSIFVIKQSDFVQKTEEVGDSNVVVASRSGTKYYYLWCSGVGRLKEANKVTFANAEEAKLRGYTKASNCPGE